jgi:hypothetical protein
VLVRRPHGRTGSGFSRDRRERSEARVCRWHSRDWQWALVARPRDRQRGFADAPSAAEAAAKPAASPPGCAIPSARRAAPTAPKTLDSAVDLDGGNIF